MSNNTTDNPALTNEELVHIQLDSEDVVLLLLEANERLLGKDVLSGITRVEKLIFLLREETGFEGVASFFTFKPHNFGPFSKEVYEAIDFLESCELIEVREKSYPCFYATFGEAQLEAEISEGEGDGGGEEVGPGATEKIFSLTGDGRKVAKMLRRAVKLRREADVQDLDNMVIRYGNIPLSQLIRYVYRRYPKMTEKSIHPEARNASRA